MLCVTAHRAFHTQSVSTTIAGLHMTYTNARDSKHQKKCIYGWCHAGALMLQDSYPARACPALEWPFPLLCWTLSVWQEC